MFVFTDSVLYQEQMVSMVNCRTVYIQGFCVPTLTRNQILIHFGALTNAFVSEWQLVSVNRP